jgi:peptidoglycan/xylan/chitin deacetylase (PgdA/CDA1 family)
MTFVAVCATERPRRECLAALPQAHVFVDDVLSLARNAALAVCDEEWIAYIDGDVLVKPGWAVPEVDDDVAVVSGPLRGDVAAHGAGAETFHGGNVAFRAPALRGVGGFWPARGHRFARDWFSEEHEAQRELARAGWRAVFDECMAARRLPSGGRLRRAARAGARRQLLGEPRTSRELLALAAKSRPAFVAEAVGGLLSARLAGRDLEPVADRTPFRASVPTPVRLPPAPPGIVLLYHRIIERPIDPLGLCVAPRHFAEQVEILRQRDVVALDELRAAQVAVTFDDGYADNLLAADLLGDLPATLFVSTGHVENGVPFWWDELRRALAAGDGPLRLGDRAWPRRSPVERRYAGAWLQGLPPKEIDLMLTELRAWAGIEPGPEPADRPLTVDELVALPWALGAHTRDHPSLRALSPDEQRAQIERSRDDLAAWTGTRPTAFSYPFGSPGGDFDATTERLVREAGFTEIVTTAPTGPGARHTVPDVSGPEFERWLNSRPPRAPRG